jgi:uncharacterized membrane protein
MSEVESGPTQAEEKTEAKDSWSRSAVKSVTWRLTGVVVLGAVSFGVTGEWMDTGIITFVYHAIQLVLYVAHERIWQCVRWGRRSS